MSLPGPSPSRGFTLIELLIAMAISAILAVGTFYLVQASRQTRETLTVQNEYYSQLTRVVRTLTSDLHQWAPNREIRDPFGDMQPAMAIDFDGFHLTRNGWALSRFVELERSSLQRVSYRLAEPGSELCEWRETSETEEGGCLVRSHRVHLDDDGRLEWRHQTLLRPVRALTWRFLVEAGEQTEFRDEWPPEASFGDTVETTVKAVELRLVTGQGDDLTRLVRVPEWPRSAEGDDDAN